MIFRFNLFIDKQTHFLKGYNLPWASLSPILFFENLIEPYFWDVAPDVTDGDGVGIGRAFREMVCYFRCF